MSEIIIINDPAGAIVMPEGFQAGAAYCGLKKDITSLDMGIIFSTSTCETAAVFTNNKIVAAPIKFSKNIINSGNANAIVINSGNANACTGGKGDKDAEDMAKITAGALNINYQDVIVASTGIIGHPMQMDKVQSGIEIAAKDLGRNISNGSNVANAIKTTDKFIKEAAVKVKDGDVSFTVGGIAKGSGMISPDMATMLCFITTDAKISRERLNHCLQISVNKSFNRITVDGHTSTNDMVAILANGANAQCKQISDEADIQLFQKALDYITLTLAKKIIEDGEGATKFIQIDVMEAKSDDDADKITRAIANSPLVKTAINGEDYNWGRIVSAAGYSGAQIDESCLRLFINKVLIYSKGTPVDELISNDETFHAMLQKEMQKKDITICLQLGMGTGSSTMWTCDFSHEYVTINAEYHT